MPADNGNTVLCYKKRPLMLVTFSLTVFSETLSDDKQPLNYKHVMNRIARQVASQDL